MTNIQFEIPGLAQFAEALEQLGMSVMNEAIAPAVYAEANILMTKIKRDDVPVDTGALRSTGQVKQPEITGSAVRVELGFGGPAAPYALFVHEKTENHHNVGRAKYLEAPVNEYAGQFETNLATRIRSRLERRMA